MFDRIFSRFQSRLLTALFCLATTFLTVGSTEPAFAQLKELEEAVEASKETLAEPLAIINVASLDRVLSDITFVFEASERLDMMDNIDSMLEKANNLEGFDRTRPMGAMIFLTAGLPPTPEMVGYIPVDSIDTLIKTAELGQVVGRKIEDNKYEIIGERNTIYVQMQHDYAFVGNSEELLDREFPDPVRYNRTMTSLYDISATGDLSNVPKGIKDVFLNFLKIQMGSELQRRDDEPLGAYKIRAANGEQALEMMELTLKHAKRITLGINASEEDRNAKFEFRVDANEDSPLADYLKKINAKRSSFERLVDEENPLSVTASFSISDREKTAYLEMLEGAELELNYRLAGGGTDIERDAPPANPAISQIFTALKDTVRAGHLDGFAKFFGDPKKAFVAVGGIKMLNGSAAASGIQTLMNTIRDADEIKSLDINADEHQGVAFHRIQGPGRAPENVYGGVPSLYLGVGPRTLWFAVGGEDAMPNLKKAMDQLAEPAEGNPLTQENLPPFRMVFNGAQWMNLPSREREAPDDADEKTLQRYERQREAATQRRDWAKKALVEGEDRLIVDYRPVDNGARLQVQVDEGFLRMLGQAVAYGVDNRDRWREERQRRGGDRSRGRRRPDQNGD